jgi:hypothetical protein
MGTIKFYYDFHLHIVTYWYYAQTVTQEPFYATLVGKGSIKWQPTDSLGMDLETYCISFLFWCNMNDKSNRIIVAFTCSYRLEK